MLAGLVVVLAALTLAGQSIVLDYLMGLLILAEGQYYKGDWIAVGTVEGTVEEVGIRRTIVRDASGTVHSMPTSMAGRRRLRADARWTAPSEFRRRLVTALDAAGIDLPQRGRLVLAAPPASDLARRPAEPPTPGG